MEKWDQVLLEKGNDGEKYETQAVLREANQHDFDVF